MNNAKIAIIGSGFAGLAASALLAKEGFKVSIYEKNDRPGGRARTWHKDGFTFDMGPSWYWMPDVFEDFFALFGKKVSDYYDLKRLDPGYRIYFGKDKQVNIPANLHDLEKLFEELEPGSSGNLKKFLTQAEYKYRKGMQEYVFRPSNSIMEYLDLKLLFESFRIEMFTSVSKHVRSLFKNPELIKILEFPVLFLGATPQNTPALYSMMNYADLVLGTWYPMGGMSEIVKAMLKLAESLGVDIRLDTEVRNIEIENFKATGISTTKGFFEADIVISNADYRHSDQILTEKKYRNYSAEYWDSRVLSPSSLLFYVGLNKKLKNIEHHNLFFDQDFEKHAEEIYTNPQWPSKPLFYVSCTSKTDSSAAPEGCENLFFLIPIAPGLQDTEEMREKYFSILLERFEQLTGETIRESVIVKRSYAVNDFVKDYNSFKGNAYGLANTLMQTAFLKPKMHSKKVKNLFFTGQLTVPGPGVPPAIISGRVVAGEILKLLSGKR